LPRSFLHCAHRHYSHPRQLSFRRALQRHTVGNCMNTHGNQERCTLASRVR
jgi:hypothetical protein